MITRPSLKCEDGAGPAPCGYEGVSCPSHAWAMPEMHIPCRDRLGECRAIANRGGLVLLLLVGVNQRVFVQRPPPPSRLPCGEAIIGNESLGRCVVALSSFMDYTLAREDRNVNWGTDIVPSNEGCGSPSLHEESLTDRNSATPKAVACGAGGFCNYVDCPPPRLTRPCIRATSPGQGVLLSAADKHN